MVDAGLKFVGRERDTVKALKKMWFIMDLPQNGVRIGTVHNEAYWTDQDIFMGTFFLFRLDMRLTDPVDGTGEMGLRQLMMGQRSLYPLRDLLLGKMSKIELLKCYVRYDFHPRVVNLQYPCFGVPAHLIGRGCVENWGLGQERLMRPDQLLLREQNRRRLNLHMRYLDIVRFGFANHQVRKSKIPEEKMTIVDDPTGMEWLVKRSREAGEEWEARQAKVKELKEAEAKAQTEVVVKPKKENVWCLGKKKIS